MPCGDWPACIPQLPLLAFTAWARGAATPGDDLGHRDVYRAEDEVHHALIRQVDNRCSNCLATSVVTMVIVAYAARHSGFDQPDPRAPDRGR